jgi:hypothetical protein
VKKLVDDNQSSQMETNINLKKSFEIGDNKDDL